MGVVLFKFREGCNDLVVSLFLLDIAALRTILSVWYAHQTLLPFSLSPWPLPAEEAIPWTIFMLAEKLQ